MAIDPVSLAITAAMTAVNMAVTASQTIEGPRLRETGATVADYGTPLNYFVGQRLLNCSSFFAKPIKEVRKKRKGKGGKQVEYSGFGTWASHVADHEIGGILKIWFDNHLVYDNTGASEEIYPLAEDYDLEAHMRFYLGGEEQMPDPDMAAYIEARDGPGTCPAYRPTSYIYFENIPLEMLGNRFPSVTVLTGTATPAIFKGWYARAKITLVNPTANFAVNANFFVRPDHSTQQDLTDMLLYWPGTANEWFPDGVPTGWYDEDREEGAPLTYHQATVYWVDPNVMNSQEFWLRLQFQNGSVGPDMRVKFEFQYWDGPWVQPEPKPASTVLDPGWPSESFGNPFDVYHGWPLDWYFDIAPTPGQAEGSTWEGKDTFATLEQLLTMVATRARLDPEDVDWTAGEDIIFRGYSWTQGTGRQILEPVLDLLDTDVRPHDFKLQLLPRGETSHGAIATAEMVRRDGAPYDLQDVAAGDLPRRLFLTYADATIDQAPNVAMPIGPDPDSADSVREFSLDMLTMALEPTDAQRLIERRLRRTRFARTGAEFSVTRQRLALEPGDVWTTAFDDRAWTMRNLKVTIGADGVVQTEWERDNAAIAILAAVEGGSGSGWLPEVIPDDIETVGVVLDVPLLVDVHDQTAPLAYIVAGPAEPGTWTGADFAISDTGELDSYTTMWAGVASDSGSIMGETANVLPATPPWVPDLGSVLEVTINVGALEHATLEELLVDPARNLAAIESGDGWELVQFMTATLVGEKAYELSGFLRGVRGTEWAMAGHSAGDRFILLENAKLQTMGAAKIGDTDYLVAGPYGHEPKQDQAVALTYSGASHKPYAPVNPVVTLDGADLEFSATRRTRIGGASVNGQDVPLGETGESWSLDIMDGATVKRTLAGSSLPLVYTEADQVSDWGAPLATNPEANLYQVSPPLSLRGYPLNFPEGLL